MLYTTLACIAIGTITILCVMGYPTNLNKVKNGDVISFDYLQPHQDYSSRLFEQVVDRQPMTLEQITRLNNRSSYRRNDPIFERDGDLVTTKDKNGHYHHYYTNRGVRVRKHLLVNHLLAVANTARQ
jgi:hypothetical protein